jgi:hypothetical protein
MTFIEEARTAASAWKQATTTLPEAARADGPYSGHRPTYPFALPRAYRPYNLLPDARAVGLSRFAAAFIRWHRGYEALPCTHLLSSQVQCVNALGPMVRDAEAIIGAFGELLDIDEVLPFGDESFDPADLVAFEWNGLADYLHEWGDDEVGQRGARTTSVDAAIRFRTTTGAVEIALIEWKYTEQYSGRPLAGGDPRNVTRIERYEQLFAAGPVRAELVSLNDLLVEPYYQLLRQQLLAQQMEAAQELGATRVRVVYAAPSRNAELWASTSPLIAERAGTDHVLQAWRTFLRPEHADRFLWFDTAALVRDDAPTSGEFAARYGHLAVPTAAP